MRHRATSAGADLGVALAADQDDLVVDVDRAARDVGDVDHRGVHRDVADDRHADAADEDLGPVRERSRPAVAVAERQGRDPARTRRPPGRAVRHAVAGRQVRDPDRPGAEGQDRAEVASPPGTQRRRRPDPGCARAARRARARTSTARAGRRRSAARAEQDRRRSRRDAAAARRSRPRRGAASAASNRATWLAVIVGDLRLLEVRSRRRSSRAPAARIRARGVDRVLGRTPRRARARSRSRARSRGPPATPAAVAAASSASSARPRRRRRPIAEPRRVRDAAAAGSDRGRARGASMPASRRTIASSSVATHSAVGAGRVERPGDRHHPVAVGVGLDDGQDRRRRAGHPPDRREVARRAPRVSISIQAVRRRGGSPAAARRASIDGRSARRGQVRGSAGRPVASPSATGARRASAGSARRGATGRVGLAAPPEPGGRTPNPRRPPGLRRSAIAGEPLAGDRDRLRQVRGEQARVAEPLADACRRRGRGGRRRAGPRRTARGAGRGASRSCPRRTSPVPPRRERRVLERRDRTAGRRAPRSPSSRPSGRRPGSRPSAASRAAIARAGVVGGQVAVRPRGRGRCPPGAGRTRRRAASGRDGRRSPSHQPSIVASERSASASRTIGAAPPSSPAARSSRTSSAVARPGRRPGPMTIASCSWSRIRASAGSGSTSSTSSSGRAIVVASTTFAANSGWSDSGTASVTSPAPARPAARQTSSAAPA